MSRLRIKRGKRGENLAAEFLEQLGYTILARNYRQRTGEIDIIALDGDTYVFVEVKTRQGNSYGTPVEAVTPHKQRQISNTARAFLSTHGLYDSPARFDVIGINLAAPGTDLVHLIAAFETNSS